MQGHISSTVNQQLHDGRTSSLSGQHDCSALIFVNCVDRGATTQEKLHQVPFVVHRCHHQRGVAVLILRIDIRAVSDEKFSDILVSTIRCPHESSGLEFRTIDAVHHLYRGRWSSRDDGLHLGEVSLESCKAELCTSRHDNLFL